MIKNKFKNRYRSLRELIVDHDTPESARISARLLVIFFLFICMFLIFIPWQQTSDGTGKVMAYLPQERVQNIHATVNGRVKHWYVQEGTFVKKDDPILEIIDTDPLFLERIKTEREASLKQYEAAQSVTKNAKYDFDRQENLFKQGFSARKEFEQATIQFKTAQSAEAQALAALTQVDNKLARQTNQLVKAPRDGTVVRLLFGTSSVIVKEGDVLAVFVPLSDKPAAEIFVSGNDLPLINEGREVRLQFEGWPAVQFTGWPSVAIGTFGAKVTMIDQTANAEGKFRVIVVPSEGHKWPASRYIRQGTRVNGWILLNRVSLGYEIWRKFNGFPPVLDSEPKTLEKLNSQAELNQ